MEPSSVNLASDWIDDHVIGDVIRLPHSSSSSSGSSDSGRSLSAAVD